MSSPTIVRVTRNIAAPVERVFDAWTNPADAGQFLFATEKGKIVRCDIDARVGGTFLIVDRRPEGHAEHHGKYLEVDRPRRLAFLFRGPGTDGQSWSKVSVEFSDGTAGCRVTITHEIPAEWVPQADRVRHGWTMILASLSSHMEKENG